MNRRHNAHGIFVSTPPQIVFNEKQTPYLIIFKMLFLSLSLYEPEPNKYVKSFKVKWVENFRRVRISSVLSILWKDGTFNCKNTLFCIYTILLKYLLMLFTFDCCRKLKRLIIIFQLQSIAIVSITNILNTTQMFKSCKAELNNWLANDWLNELCTTTVPIYSRPHHIAFQYACNVNYGKYCCKSLGF